MDDKTLLHRVIKPDWWLQEDAVSSQAFRPQPHDEGQLSVYDGDQIKARSVWLHYSKDDSKPAPVGVLAVSVGDCKQQDLPLRPDPETFPEHVLIDFRRFSKNQTKKRSGHLRDAAVERGWQYRS